MRQTINFLREWTVNFAKNKDIFLRTIVEVKEMDREIVIIHKHKEHKYFIDPFLENLKNDLKSLKDDSHASIMCLNTIENFNRLIENWKLLAAYRHLNLVFVNPFSEMQKFWAIFPYTHDKIADEESLKLGLQTMFEQVEPIDKNRIEKAIS